MKRILCAVTMGLMIGGFVIASVHPITFPTPGYRLCMGKTCEIRWDKDYFQEDGVKIVLYTSAKKRIRVLTITINNGAWRWTVPDNLAEGDYQLYIRGNGPDTAPQHFGHVFKILNCKLRMARKKGFSNLHQTRPQTTLPAQGAQANLNYVDLKITRLWVEGDGVKALVNNTGTAPVSGMVDFALNVNGDDVFGYNSTPEGIQLNIAPKNYQKVSLPCLVHAIPADKTGRIWLKATVDVTNKVVELNDANNTKEASYPWGVHSIEVRVEKSHYNVDCQAGGYLKPKITVVVNANAACTVRFRINRGEGLYYQRGNGIQMQKQGDISMNFSGPGSQSTVLSDNLCWYPILNKNGGNPITWYVNAEVTYPAIRMKSGNVTFTTSCSP